MVRGDGAGNGAPVVVLMSVYVIFYSFWWALGWGGPGAVAFALSATGGALATGGYAVYTILAYRRLCRPAGVTVPR